MSTIGIASHGLQIAESQFNAAANKIVNLSVPHYDPQQVYQNGVPTGVAVDDINPTDRPEDLTTETIAEKQAALMYGANAMVLKTANQTYGSLLNVLDTDNNNFNPDGTAKF
jgi:flagellar basal body rod protein FlgC